MLYNKYHQIVFVKTKKGGNMNKYLCLCSLLAISVTGCNTNSEYNEQSSGNKTTNMVETTFDDFMNKAKESSQNKVEYKYSTLTYSMDDGGFKVKQTATFAKRDFNWELIAGDYTLNKYVSMVALTISSYGFEPNKTDTKSHFYYGEEGFKYTYTDENRNYYYIFDTNTYLVENYSFEILDGINIETIFSFTYQ